MPKKTTEERLATLEAQVQGLADHLTTDVNGFSFRGYRLKWALSDESTEPEWSAVYDWQRDPTHPLHQKAENHA